MSSHTLILLQYTSQPASRTFYDYRTVTAAAEGITALFEKQLREQNPRIARLQYSIDDLYYFIDQMTDVSALVFDNKLQAYVPYTKQWVKKILANHISKQFQGR